MYNSADYQRALELPIGRRSATAVYTLPNAGAPTIIEVPPGLYSVRCPDGVAGKSVQLFVIPVGAANPVAADMALPTAGAGFKNVVSRPSEREFTLEIETLARGVAVLWDGAGASTLIFTMVRPGA